MQKEKLTIRIDEQVCEGLHVVDATIEEEYCQMAADEAHESEELEWSEALARDVADENMV